VWQCSTPSRQQPANSTAESNQSPDNHTPPVEEGERRRVEIEGIGEEGDGTTSVERSYIIFVPEAEQHEQVTIEITSVTPRYAFAGGVERETDTE
jgi:predicted RNA-binding protein with TRAM domain